jgi:hypothetical protein
MLELGKESNLRIVRDAMANTQARYAIHTSS